MLAIMGLKRALAFDPEVRYRYVPDLPNQSGVECETTISRRGPCYLGIRRPRGGPTIPIASDHPDRTIRRGRPGRYPGTHPDRCHEDVAWPGGHHRECDRRVGHHRRRPRGARRPRRVHRQHRQLAFARRERSDLRAAVRRAEGFRTGRASAQQSLCHRGTEGPTGKQPERTDCLAQGQPGQGDTGHGRTRFGTTRQRASTSRMSPGPASSSCRIAPAPPRLCGTCSPDTSI